MGLNECQEEFTVLNQRYPAPVGTVGNRKIISSAISRLGRRLDLMENSVISTDYGLLRNNDIVEIPFDKMVSIERYQEPDHLEFSFTDESGFDTQRNFYYDRNEEKCFKSFFNKLQSSFKSIQDIPEKTSHPTVIIKEIVRVPCAYCNTLVDVTEKRCPSCGAPGSQRR